MPDIIDQIHAAATGAILRVPNVFDDIHAQATGSDSDLGFEPVSSAKGDDSDLGFSDVKAAIDMNHPAGAVGPLPGVSQPQVDMQVPSVGKTIADAYYGAQSRGMQHATVAGPDGRPVDVLVPNYGQNAIPEVQKGLGEVVTPGERTKGATDILGGVNEGLGSSLLPVGVAPFSVAAGVAGSAAGGYIAPKAVKALGGNQQQQDLAREAGSALPFVAGVGTDLLTGRPAAPDYELAPRAPGGVEVRQINPLQLGAGEPTPPLALPAGENVPQLTAGDSETVPFSPQPNPQTPPPFDENSARMRVQPTQAAANPTPAPVRGMTVDEHGNVTVGPAGLLPGHAPTGADAEQTDNFQNYLTQHPAGKVTGIDQATGLPIVDRTRSSLVAQGDSLPPQTAVAGPMSPEAEAVSKEAEAVSKEAENAAQRAAKNPDLKPEIATATNQPQPVGETDPSSGRVITQPSDNPVTNQALATDAMPEYRDGLESAIQDIPGAELAATRSAKNPVRMAEKIAGEDQPAETLNDYGAAQISVDSPQAANAVIAAVQQKFPVIRVQDNFAQGDPDYGYRSYSMQVQMPNGASQELQIVPKEVHDVNAAEHKDYKEARNAELTGQNADDLKAAAKAQNDAAMERFNARNGSGNTAVTEGAGAPVQNESSGTALAPRQAEAGNQGGSGRSILAANARPEEQAAEGPNGKVASLRGWEAAEAGEPEERQFSRDRTRGENRSGLKFSVTPAGGNHAAVITLSHDGMSFLEKSAFLRAVNAVHLNRMGADWIVGRLRGDGLGELADAINANRSRDGGAILTRSGLGAAVLREEHWHDFQNVFPDAHKAGVERARAAHPEAFKRATEDVRKTYHDAGDDMVAKEVFAKIAGGSDIHISDADKQALHAAYMEGVAGKGIIEHVPESAPELRTGGDYEASIERRGEQEVLGGRQGSNREGDQGRVDTHQLRPRLDEKYYEANLGPVGRYIREEAGLVKTSREIHSGLQDLDPQYDADVLRANGILENLPGTPADQEQVYHHLEDPTIPLTKAQREIHSQLSPLEKQSAAIFGKLYPEKKQVGNYVHRIAQQKGSLLDRILGGSKSTGKDNLLKKNASAGKKRSMLALESPTGQRQVVSVGRGRVTAWHGNVPSDIGPLRAGMTNPEEILDERLAPLEKEEKKLKQEQRTLNETPSRQAAAGRRLQNIANRLQEIESEKGAIEHQHIAENLPDKVWRDKDGKTWTFKQATTKEIEKDTPVEYYKNAAASVVTNWLELRRAERAHDYLEDLKQDPQFNSLAVKPSNPGQIPEGWRSTQLPQFSGYYFEPHVAEVFDQYAKDLARGDPGVFEKVSNFLTTSIFLNPIAHIPNLTANWLAEKGLSPLDLRTLGPEFKAGVRAFNAIVHQNRDFLDALDAGAPLQSQKREVRQFSELLIKRLQEEAEKPEVLERLQAALGKAVNIPAVMQEAVSWMSSKLTWPVHDLYFLQSAYLKMEQRGMSLSQALKDTATYIPDERLPTRVFNSKKLGDLMRSPALMFTHYHYGVLKAWGKILQNFSGLGFDEADVNPKGEPVNAAGRTKGGERARAVNVAAGLAIALSVVYPELDKLLAKATGNKDARLRRAGLLGVADSAARAAKGEITPLQAARTAVTPSVLAETGADLAANRDLLYNGRKIYDPHGTKTEIAEEVGRRVLGAISPGELAMRALESRESLKKVLYSLIGVSFPRHGAIRLAAELRAAHMPDNVENPEERKKDILRSQARYLAWQGDTSGLTAARKSGLFTTAEMDRLYMQSKADPLLYEAKGLGIKDLLTLYEFRGTTAEDKRKLLPLLRLKAPSIQGIPKEERDDVRKRFHAAMHER